MPPMPQSGQGLPARGNATPNDNNLYIARNFYTYEADTPAALAAAGAAQYTFNIAKDSDFFWTKFTAHAVVGGAATTVSAEQLPEVTILLTNSTNGRQYMNAPVPLASMSGSGRLPFILPIATLWEALTTIQVTLANLGNADYSQLYLSFQGIKAFLKPANQ